MKKDSGDYCPVCGNLYSENNWKSRHHILPKRFYHGGGGLFTLCRNCHNELELLIPLSKKLDESQYKKILKNFIKKKKDEKRKKEIQERAEERRVLVYGYV